VHLDVAVQEGLWWQQQGGTGYEGSINHQPPLLLAAASILQSLFAPLHANAGILFIAADLLAALMLARTTALFLRTPEASYNVPTKNTAQQNATYPALVAMLYLLNPVTIATCAAKSLVVFTNTLNIMAIMLALTRMTRHVTRTRGGSSSTDMRRSCGDGGCVQLRGWQVSELWHA
jgi:hypothetical protein